MEVIGSNPILPTKTMITKYWHNWLGMKKHGLAWHQADIDDELTELNEAHSFIERWSEKSDVVYTYTRARWAGHQDINFPLITSDYLVGWVYMIPKYSMRWFFFKTAGRKLDAEVHAVRNPRKIYKLHEIAEKNKLDPLEFEKICVAQLRYWKYFLLK